MTLISISDLPSQSSQSLLSLDILSSFKNEKSSLRSSLISAAVDRSLNARKISGGYSTLCGGRLSQDS